jgi:dienelactone hydrolase
MIDDRRRSTPNARAAALLVIALVLVAAACASDPAPTGSGSSSDGTGAASGDGSSGSAPTGTEPGSAATYAGPGPYVAGTTTYDLDGRAVLVWYPAEPSSATNAAKRTFEIFDLLPDFAEGFVPDDLNVERQTDAFVEIPPSGDGPFPLVLLAHGFAAHPSEFEAIVTHLASWGFVVAAPDFHERSLTSQVIGTGVTTSSPDAAATAQAAQADLDLQATIMSQTRELLAAENTTPRGLLEGTVDAAEVGTIGHGVGATSAIAAAVTDPDVKTFVVISGGKDPAAPDALPTPTVPGMVMTGAADEVAPLADVERFYQSLHAPKRLVVIADAGHNAFNDLCLVGAEHGGLVGIADETPFRPSVRVRDLLLDGCRATDLPPADAWVPMGHFLVAQFRYELGVDAAPVGLEPGIETAFLPTAVTYRVAES